MIDEDRGISGTSVENRPGFQRLLAEIALGHVLIVFGREMSRLARSCADWHRLLERSALFQVLLGDADGVYDPVDFDDRLLLGLKGTMSEAELHILRGPGKGRLVWRRPRRSTLYEMLRHPICAGAYTFGRCPFDPTRRTPGNPKSGRRNVPREDWICLLKDKVPAYISWEQFEQNGRRLAANDRGPGSKKATGRAPTLLNGVVRCGRWGKPMAARNARASANPRYA